MNNPGKCPFCGSGQLFSGSIKSSEGYVFRPFEARVPLLQFVLVDGIDFGPNAELCANCGRLWSQTNLVKARGFIETYGSEAARAILAENSSGPACSSTPPSPDRI